MTLLRRRAGTWVPAVCALILAGCHTARPSTTPTAPATNASRLTSLDTLRRDIDATLATPALEPGTWGVLVRSLSRNETLYARNPRSLLVPASNLKIVTLAAAADRLGWDYTYETRVLRRGTVEGGVLSGDLVVAGSGDPSLSEDDGSAQRVFQSWADGLKQLGVHTVSGRIIGDDNAFDDEGFGAGWMWDDMDQAYSAAVGALQLNVDAVAVMVTPGAVEGAPATLTVASDGSGLTFKNLVTTAASATPARVVTRRIANRTVLEVSGTVPIGSAPAQTTVAVENPTLYFVSSLRKTLIASGIEVRGEAVDIDDLAADAVAGTAPLFAHRSPPLSQLADTLMKVSQNQYAETLVKTLGAQAGSPTFDAGRRVVRDTIASWGVPPSDILYADGSGLSRYDLVSAQTLVTILTHVANDARLRPPFEASLPVAGAAGMLSNRLKGTTVRAKTGSMGNVRSISGYLETAESEPAVFAIIANNYGIPSSEVDRVSDAVLTAVAQFRR